MLTVKRPIPPVHRPAPYLKRAKPAPSPPPAEVQAALNTPEGRAFVEKRARARQISAKLTEARRHYETLRSAGEDVADIDKAVAQVLAGESIVEQPGSGDIEEAARQVTILERALRRAETELGSAEARLRGVLHVAALPAIKARAARIDKALTELLAAQSEEESFNATLARFGLPTVPMIGFCARDLEGDATAWRKEARGNGYL